MRSSRNHDPYPSIPDLSGTGIGTYLGVGSPGVNEVYVVKYPNCMECSGNVDNRFMKPPSLLDGRLSRFGGSFVHRRFAVDECGWSPSITLRHHPMFKNVHTCFFPPLRH